MKTLDDGAPHKKALLQPSVLNNRKLKSGEQGSRVIKSFITAMAIRGSAVQRAAAEVMDEGGNIMAF